MILTAIATLLNITCAAFCWCRIGKQQAIRQILEDLSKAYAHIGRQCEIIDQQQEIIKLLKTELEKKGGKQ